MCGSGHAATPIPPPPPPPAGEEGAGATPWVAGRPAAEGGTGREVAGDQSRESSTRRRGRRPSPRRPRREVGRGAGWGGVGWGMQLLPRPPELSTRWRGGGGPSASGARITQISGGCCCLECAHSLPWDSPGGKCPRHRKGRSTRSRATRPSSFRILGTVRAPQPRDAAVFPKGRESSGRMRNFLKTAQPAKGRARVDAHSP